MVSVSDAITGTASPHCGADCRALGVPTTPTQHLAPLLPVCDGSWSPQTGNVTLLGFDDKILCYNINCSTYLLQIKPTVVRQRYEAFIRHSSWFKIPRNTRVLTPRSPPVMCPFDTPHQIWDSKVTALGSMMEILQRNNEQILSNEGALKGGLDRKSVV